MKTHEEFEEMDFMEGIGEDSIPDLTIEQQEELERRIKDFDDPICYVVAHLFSKDVLTLSQTDLLNHVKSNFTLSFFYNIDDTYVLNEWGSKFKRKDCAIGIAKALKKERIKKGLFCAHLVIKINKNSSFDFNNILEVEAVSV